MSLENMKVTPLDKENYGIMSVSDILDGTASENKEKFDRLPNFIADKHNEVVSFVENNIYTKTQTNTAIDEKVKEIGSADMTKAVYATTTKEGYVDKSIVSDNGVFFNTQLLDVLTGEGENIKFFATDSSTYSVFKRNEIEYAVKQGEEAEITLVVGALYNGVINEGNKTINFTSGGAGGLDIKIIAQLERPATPKENTIWIKSDLTLNLKTYKIGYEYPASPIQGDLFFKVTDIEGAYLYVGKKQQVEISLIGCEYWDGVSWLSKKFETYADSQWHTGGLLYYNGNISPLAGDFIGGTKQDTKLYLAGSYVQQCTEKVIDLTDVDYVDFTGSAIVTGGGSTTAHYYVTATNQLDSPPKAKVDFFSSFATKVTRVDVRTLTGSYYIKMLVYSQLSSNSMTTQKIELIYKE